MNRITRNFLITIFSICGLYILVPKIWKPNCEDSTNNIREENCEIRIKRVEHLSSFKIIGENPKTSEPCECEHGNRWWQEYKNEMKEGDYFIKKKGDLFLQIVKKDTVITHTYKCYET